MKKKKLIFIESLLKDGGGHHMDNLIETSLYFKKNNEIHWLLNENFKKKKLYIPDNVILNPCIPDENKDLFEKTKNLFFLIFLFIKEKRLLKFIQIFCKNFFSIPRYFNHQVFNYFKIQKFEPEDTVVIQSCRPKDVELVYFLSGLIEKMPKIIMRILYPPKKKKLKNFYYHTQKLIDDKKHVKIFTEVSSIKDYIKKRLDYDVQNFTQIYSFHNRTIPKKFTLGFLGESRIDKGFDRLPNFINILLNNGLDCNFIIQFSKKIYSNTDKTKKQITDISKFNSNIKIIDGYIDFWEYRNLLKEINIMPLLYESDKLNFVGSGLFYSCITNEIPMIIPSKADLLDEYLMFNSFEKANTDEEYMQSVKKIIKNYGLYLTECKKLSSKYKKSLLNDPLVREIN